MDTTVSYGPTYNRLEWTVPMAETVRFQLHSPMSIDLKWTDQSVSWKNINQAHGASISQKLLTSLFT